MKRPIAPRTHGYLDYLAVPFLALAPTLFDFRGLPASLCYLFAGVLLVLSLLTAYPLGVAKVIPFTVHGGIEAVSAPLLVLAPFLLGFSRDTSARNFFIAAGLGLGVLFLLTNYRAAERPSGRVGAERRSYV